MSDFIDGALVRALGFALALIAGVEEVGAVAQLQVRVDGRATGAKAEQVGGVVWVQAAPFARALEAEFKKLADGPWAVCRGDLCIALGEGDWRESDGHKLLALDAVAAPLQVQYAIREGSLHVTNATKVETGLGVGQVPPAFALPDLYTGERVESSSFIGKKTFFYMWASW